MEHEAQGQPPQGAAAPTGQQPAPVAAPQAPAAPLPGHSQPPEPDWLNGRLEQAKRAGARELLTSLGLQSPDEVKTRLAAAKALEDANLSEAEKVKKQLEELTPKAARAEVLEKRLAQVTETEFAKLPEQVRAAIDAKANGDNEARWDLMRFAHESGLLTAAAAPTGTPAPVAQPPTQIPSPPRNPAAPKTAFETWQSLQKENPVRASLYRQMNAAEVEKTKPASA